MGTLRSDPLKRLDQSAEMLAGDDLVELNRGVFRWRVGTSRRQVISAAVGAMIVVVIGELGDEMVQVPFPEGNEMVQAFALDVASWRPLKTRRSSRGH